MAHNYPWYKRLNWWYCDTTRHLKLRSEALLRKLQGGYECTDCGTLCYFKDPQYSGTVNGKGMMIEAMGLRSPFGKTVCPHCLYDRIEQYWVLAEILEADEDSYINTSSGIYQGECYWFGTQELVCEGIRNWRNSTASQLGLNCVVFGGQWWNGHAASIGAVKELLTKTGKTSTGVMVNVKGRVSGASSMGIHFDMSSCQYTDGRVTGDRQCVSDIIQRT